MEKYLFKNWVTLPFKKKSFEGQLDRYAKVCIVSIENPDKVIDIIPLYGKKYDTGIGSIIKLIYDIEQRFPLDNKSKMLLDFIQKPMFGKFEEIESKHGLLFRRYTLDEAKYGLCPATEVWKPEVDESGTVKLYNTMKVFTRYTFDSESGKYNYTRGWSPDEMYKRYFRYRYLPLSQLAVPVV